MVRLCWQFWMCIFSWATDMLSELPLWWYQTGTGNCSFQPASYHNREAVHPLQRVLTLDWCVLEAGSVRCIVDLPYSLQWGFPGRYDSSSVKQPLWMSPHPALVLFSPEPSFLPGFSAHSFDFEKPWAGVINNSVDRFRNNKRPIHQSFYLLSIYFALDARGTKGEGNW